MGGFKHSCQLGEGYGVQSLPRTTHPMQKTWYFHLCDSCTESSPAAAAVKGKQWIPAPSSTSRCRFTPNLSLAGGNSSYGLCIP